MYDILLGLLIVIAALVLQQIDMSRTYHFIRGQTIVKLYVLTSMLEVLERLLTSFGQDAFDSLSATSRSGPKSASMLLSVVAFGAYVICHGALYFFHVATLTVALNASDNSLITLLVANNFAELKMSVFKKFDVPLLFQLTCTDVTERFQLTLFLGCVIAVAYANAAGSTVVEVLQSFVSPIAMMMLGEMVADWIKHAFITKFNKIDAVVYQDYARLLREDILTCHREKMSSDYGNTFAVTKRVGLSQVSEPVIIIITSCLS